MEQHIIYPSPAGGVCVVMPFLGSGLTLEQIAAKDVPEGQPWRIVDAASLPDRATRARWLWTASGPLAIAPEVTP